MSIGPQVEELIRAKFGPRAQNRAAEAMGISPAYLSDICNGRRGISADVAVKISDVFGAGVGDDLLREQLELALSAAYERANTQRKISA